MKKPLFTEVVTHGHKYHFNYDGLENIEIICPECQDRTKNIKKGFYKKFLVLKKEKFKYATLFTLKCIKCCCVFNASISDF